MDSQTIIKFDLKQNSQGNKSPLSVSPTVGYGASFGTSSRSFRTSTSTVSSESSWNSQSGLLPNTPGSIIDDHARGANTRISIARKWLFGTKCCCIGEKSIHTKTTQVPQSQRSSIEKDETIGKNCDEAVGSENSENNSSHRLSSSRGPFTDDQAIMKNGMIIANYPVFNPIRDSFELFNPENRNTARDDDMGSDASSDLFEIESFKNQTTSYQVYRRRHSLEEDSVVVSGVASKI